MKDKVVVFTEKNIHFKDNPRSIVMDAASKSLMQMYSYIVCQNGGNVLDVGFGMGFSAEEMSKLATHYTCIEINPQIYEKAKEWAKNKSNVTILFGDWIDVIPKLKQKFDGIFMDTHYDVNYKKFEDFSKIIANENCILSVFNYFSFRGRSELNYYDYTLNTEKFTIVVTPTHTINWTYFKNGNFVKGDNTIKFKSPTYLI